MDDQALDEALDDLCSQPPEEFVAARNALVRELKSAGRKDDAAMVTALRRPTRTTWALNRLARTDHDVVDELADAEAPYETADDGRCRTARGDGGSAADHPSCC